MTDIILIETVTDTFTVIETVDIGTVSVEIVEVAMQGPRGPQGIQGIQGPIGDANGAVLVSNRLNEFSTSQMKVEVRTNIELEHIDCGEFL